MLGISGRCWRDRVGTRFCTSAAKALAFARSRSRFSNAQPSAVHLRFLGLRGLSHSGLGIIEGGSTLCFSIWPPLTRRTMQPL